MIPPSIHTLNTVRHALTATAIFFAMFVHGALSAQSIRFSNTLNNGVTPGLSRLGGETRINFSANLAFPATGIYSASVSLPIGWRYVSGSLEPSTKPPVGQTGTLTWSNSPLVTNSFSFSFVVSYPSGLTTARLAAEVAWTTGTVVTTQSAELVMISGPEITQPVLSQSVAAGETVILTVGVSGPGPFTYQWSKDVVPIVGATSDTFTISNFQPADVGNYGVVVKNQITSAASSSLISFSNPTGRPVFVFQPTDKNAASGDTVLFSASAVGSAPLTYTWHKDGTVISASTATSLVLRDVTVADSGGYAVTASNSVSSVTSSPAILKVSPPVLPFFDSALSPVIVDAGKTAIFSLLARGTPPLTYQWLKNGAVISGAVGPTLVILNAGLVDVGTYSLTVSNQVGFATSTTAPLGLYDSRISRISNLSVLTSLTDSTDNFTLGYVVGGTATTGPKSILLRAAGPALGTLGVGGTLDDPKLELFAGPAKSSENDNWGNPATSVSALTAAFTAVGAFPFASPNSRDAAVTTSLTTRDNSVKISSANAGTGLVLAEIYDTTPPGSFATSSPRLLNVSVLKSLGTGLTVGFTLAGSASKTVLIRAIGPTLGDFGVPGTVADPQLALFNSASAKIAENDNWAATPALATSLTAAFTSVGAFALPATSNDAAILATLPPGGYSVQVSGVANTTGTALVEVYEVP